MPPHHISSLSKEGEFCIVRADILFCLPPATDRVVMGAAFSAGGVLECNLAHRRSIPVLCMIFNIKSNSMHPLNGALPLPYVPARVTRGASIAQKHSFSSSHCRTSHYSRTFVPISVSLWNDLGDPVFSDAKQKKHVFFNKKHFFFRKTIVKKKSFFNVFLLLFTI